MPYLQYVFSASLGLYDNSDDIHTDSLRTGQSTCLLVRSVFLNIRSMIESKLSIPWQLADWLDFYADAMELSIWLSSTVTNAVCDPDTGKWRVTVRRNDGTERLFHVDHIIFAIGWNGGTAYMPSIPGQVCLLSIFV